MQFSFTTWSERSGDRTPPKERREAKPTKATQPKAEAEGRLIAPQPTPPEVERLQRRSGGGGKAENERLQRRAVGALERREAKPTKATQPKAEAEGRLIAPQPTPPQVERLQRRAGGGGKAENERRQRRSGEAFAKKYFPVAKGGGVYT